MGEAERRAGNALRALTEVEGLSLSEAVEWCDKQISVREATRLRRLVDAGQGDGPDGDGETATAAPLRAGE